MRIGLYKVHQPQRRFQACCARSRAPLAFLDETLAEGGMRSINLQV